MILTTDEVQMVSLNIQGFNTHRDFPFLTKKRNPTWIEDMYERFYEEPNGILERF